MPDWLSKDKREIHFTNFDQKPVRIKEARLTLTTTNGTKAILGSAELVTTDPETPAGGLLICTVRQPDLPPNIYQGEVVLSGAEGIVGRAPIVWSVRAAPMPVILAIALGLVFARMGTKPAPAPAAIPADVGSTPSGARKVASFALGIPSVKDPAASWWSIVSQLVVYAVLLLTGFATLYLNGSDSFGSGGLTDYVPLFMWGFGSDVLNSRLWLIKFR